MFYFGFADFFINAARGLFTLTIGLVLYNETGELWSFAMVYLSELLITIFLQGFSGTIVDKFGEKKVLANSLLLVFLWFLSIFLIFDDFEQNTLAVVLLAVGLNLSTPFIRNAYFKITASVAERLDVAIDKANAVLSSTLQAGQIIGMVVAGLMVELEVVSLVPGLIFAFFFMSYFAILQLNRSLKSKHDESKDGEAHSWRDVFAYLQHNKKIVLFSVYGSFDFVAIAIFNLLLAPAVANIFDGQGRWLSILDLVFAIFALLAGIIVAKAMILKQESFVYTFLSVSSAALLFVLYSLDAHYIFILFAVASFGFFISFSTVVWNSAIQNLTEHQYKGRVSSVRYIIVSLIVALGVVIVSSLNHYGFAQLSLYSGGVLSSMLLLPLGVFVLNKLSIIDFSNSEKRV